MLQVFLYLGFKHPPTNHPENPSNQPEHPSNRIATYSKTT